MGRKQFDHQLVFGRSLALLLTALFGLSGLRMVLTLVPGGDQGVILGEENSRSKHGQSGSSENNRWSTTETETEEETDSLAPTTLYLTVTPTITATATPTATPTEAEEEEPTETPEPTAQPTSATTTTTTVIETTAVPAETRSAGETVRTILRQIGIPIKATPTPTPAPEKITVQEQVINERSVGEILKELETSVGTNIQRQARLRFRAVDGSVGLVAEVKSGQGYPLATEESARISEALRLGSGLSVGRGGATELVINRGAAKAATSLPLLVDLDSNTLMVETSLGIRSVAILPDTAVSRALAAGALTAVAPGDMELLERDDGKIAYRMTGETARKLFGLVSLKSAQTVDVSAESGRVLPELTSSLGETLFNLVAPQMR